MMVLKGKKRISGIVAGTVGIDLPDQSVTINDGSEAVLCGCERITVYERDEIVIRLRDVTASVCGDRLELDTYMTDRAVIRGRIDTVRFIREEE